MINLRAKHVPLIVAGACLSTIVVCLLRYSALVYQHYFGMYHDDGLYLVSAKSLADNLGYRIISLPGEPFQTKYPIVYPFVLSLIWRCCPSFPGNLAVFEAFQLTCSVLAVVVMVAYLVATRKLTICLGFVIGFVCLLNFRFIDFAPMVMSDLVSALATAVCMWKAEGECRKRDGYKPLTGFVLAFTVLLRGQTLVLLPTLLLYFFIKRRFKLLVTTAAIASFFIGVVWIWQAQHIAGVPPILYYYTSYFKHAVYTAPPWTPGMIAANAELSIVRAINMFVPGLEQIRYQQLSPMQFVLLYNCIYPLLFGIVGVGLWRGAALRSLPALFMLVYIISLLMWPCRLEWRYVLPIMVLGYFYFFVGCRTLVRQLKPYIHNKIPHGSSFSKVCSLSAIAICTGLVCASAFVSCNKVGWLNCLSDPATPKTTSDSAKAFDWIIANTPSTATFVCNNDPSLFLYTTRRGIMPSSLELWRFTQDQYVDADSLLAAINFSSATYVMNEPAFRMMGFAYPQLTESIAEVNRRQPGMLTRLYTSDKGLITIYGVKQPK